MNLYYQIDSKSGIDIHDTLGKYFAIHCNILSVPQKLMV